MNETNNTNYAPPLGGVGGGSSGSSHGECCEECKKTCKRHFWTEVLRTLVKVGTAVLAAFGLASCVGEND